MLGRRLRRARPAWLYARAIRGADFFQEGWFSAGKRADCHSNYNPFDAYDDLSYYEGMKVTAIIPDGLVNEVKYYSKGKNITDSMIIALKEWLSLKHLTDLNSQVLAQPLEFEANASSIREANRQ